MQEASRYMNYKTAMEYMGIRSYNTLYKLIADGLDVAVIGGVKMIDRNDLETFISAHKVSKEN